MNWITVARLLILALIFTTAFACDKSEDKPATDCDTSAPTTRKLTDRAATVNVGATIHAVYLVEEGSIDSKLIPCNLDHEYMQQGLKVIISGDVKQRDLLPGEPCCVENVVITNIRKQ